MLEVSHVAKSYGRRTILRDISFTAEPGEQIALIGRNGCGKSTLLRMLAGIDPIAGTAPFSGSFPVIFRRTIRFSGICRWKIISVSGAAEAADRMTGLSASFSWTEF